jgi:hypothetical protein
MKLGPIAILYALAALLLVAKRPQQASPISSGYLAKASESEIATPRKWTLGVAVQKQDSA